MIIIKILASFIMERNEEAVTSDHRLGAVIHRFVATADRKEKQEKKKTASLRSRS